MFPSWFNQIRFVLFWVLVGLPVYVGVVLIYGNSPQATDAGFRPTQPVPFSHALHAGELGMDCRYCHVAVEQGAQATIPATSICMNCHQTILGKSPNLQLVRESHQTGMPVRWTRVHDLPDFAYFDHSAHVRRGVACISCHGRIDQMDERGVFQDQPLSMGWCLECHRNPTDQIVPLNQITVMDATASESMAAIFGNGSRLSADATSKRMLSPKDALRHPGNNPALTDCSTCHR